MINCDVLMYIIECAKRYQILSFINLATEK